MSSHSLVGQTIGKYKIIEHLGRGGMAEVYKGYREDLDRTVAIKLMHPFLVAEQDFLIRFKREARAMAQMRHTNVVSVYDFDVFGDNTYYLVMEYIAGGTLKEKLVSLAEKHERLPLETSVRIALELATALAYAHDQEMVHRDIKPANIMLDENGKAILTDFGIVKLVGGQSNAFTATGALIGTPAYMSPEQALGKPGDARSDIYSLGVLLFQMATGALPFQADTPLAVVMKHVNDPPPMPVISNPDIPAGLQEIILRAMSKDPDQRFQTASDIAAALRTVDLSAAPSQATASSTIQSKPQGVTSEASPSMRTAVAATEIASPAIAGAASSPAAVGPTVKKKRSPWLFVGGGLLLLLIAAAALGLAGVIPGIPGLRPQATATLPVVAVVPSATNTETPRPTATATKVPATATATEVPSETPDIAASAEAAIALTLTAKPTNTPTSTHTPTPTKTATPNATATFLAGCVEDVELVVAYTYRQNTLSAPTSSSFPINWVLKNSGSCPWPEGLAWRYIDGAQFGYSGDPIPLASAVAPDTEITLNTSFRSPAAAGSSESSWQLVNSEGEPFGPVISFAVFTYVPATATPASPSPTATAAAAATTEVTQLAWSFNVSGCEYAGTEWRCRLQMTPYGGGGGPYTIWVFDAEQPAEYRGPGPFTHFVGARRCSPYIHEVKVQDDASGRSFSENVYVDPNNYFPGGCTE